MFICRAVLLLLAGLISTSAVRAADEPVAAVTAPSVYVPDYSHSGEPLPDGVFGWDALLKAVDLTNDLEIAKFSFSFTNLTTNVVGILSVRPSCGCTTAEMAPVPWAIAPGQSGEMKFSVNVQGKIGTLFKQVGVTTERGQKNLMLRITILPSPPMPKMTDQQRAAGIAASKADRQAVFKGSCASCHLPKIEGKYGQQLFKALCTICHEAEHRAEMVPDLHNLPVPTNEEFWRTWITYGKPGSLMPAFATSQGGPLNDLQTASLAAYLNATIPSKSTNAPAVK